MFRSTLEYFYRIYFSDFYLTCSLNYLPLKLSSNVSYYNFNFFFFFFFLLEVLDAIEWP